MQNKLKMQINRLVGAAAYSMCERERAAVRNEIDIQRNE